MLKTLFYNKEKIFYDGSQLSSGWIKRQFKLGGDSLVSFIGGCDVKFEHMIDLADLAQKNPIKSDLMLHFIGEFFCSSEIYFSFALQRIFVVILKDIIEELGKRKLEREGDDLYLIQAGEKRKLSVSVATVSTNSSLFHLGLNLTKKGAPIKVSTLREAGVQPEKLVQRIFQEFSKEYLNILEESQRVRKAEEVKD